MRQWKFITHHLPEREEEVITVEALVPKNLKSHVYTQIFGVLVLMCSFHNYIILFIIIFMNLNQHEKMTIRCTFGFCFTYIFNYNSYFSIQITRKVFES